jgi:cytochrome c
LSADAERGRQWAKTCKACHDIDSHQPDHPQGGPNLHDVYLSLAGTQSLKLGYQYHPPLIAARNAGVMWTDDNLCHYLEGPEAFLHQATGQSFALRFI